MTIVYLFYEYLAEGVGGLSHVWEVCTNLQQQGHNVLIFIPRCGDFKVDRPLAIKYVPTINIRFLRFLSFHLLSLLYVGFYMIKHHVDIIYAREMILSLTPFVLSKIFKKPMITEINGDLLTEYQLAGYPQFFLDSMRRVEEIVCKASQALVCVTEGLGSIFLKRYQLACQKVKIISNGTDTDRFFPLDRNLCRKRLGIDPSTRLVGFAGTFVPHQGLECLVRSSNSILAESPDVIFLLVGDGPLRGDIMDSIQSMGLMEYFRFPGIVSQDEIVFFINAMDVCVAPFTQARNELIGLSPLKLYDYMACGRPIVASDIKGVGDLLREHKLGIATRPDDPISLAQGVVSALEDRVMAARCLQKGPALVRECFTWRITAEKVAEVCFQAIDEAT